MKRPPDPIFTPLAITGLLLSAASTGVSVGELVTGSNVAEQSGKDQQKAADRLAAIRAGEARDTRRRLAARAQAMGAAAGSPTSEASVFQIGRNVDEQAAIDIWDIRQRGVDARAAANQQAYALRSQAVSSGISGGASLIKSGFDYHQLGIPGFGKP